jgi:hypothetical protein
VESASNRAIAEAACHEQSEELEPGFLGKRANRPFSDS